MSELINGVNDNGVYYIKDGTKYYCYYYLGEEVQLTSYFNDVSEEFINNLTYEDLVPKEI